MTRGRLVPGVPFLFSLVLSLSTVSSNVFWPDSGFFLAGIREAGVLYPTGFVLYILISKLWTTLLFFIDFTLAAHLFCSFCAAGAAAGIAVATRDLLVSKGGWLGAGREDPEGWAGWSGALTGCLAASGFTFWFAGVYAKPYAFLYLVLALLLWRMVRADASKSPRDLTVVAALIGLAWQAHPMTILLGPALLLFVALHVRVVGPAGVAGRTLLAAAIALGPVLLLPILSARDPLLAFDEPRDLAGLFDYLSSERYTRIRGVFGWDGPRVRDVGLFWWQEWLGIGGAAFAVGAGALYRWNRRIAIVAALWCLPLVGFAAIFKIEHQLDHWCLAGWIVLYPVIGAGFFALASRAGRHARKLLVTLGAAAGVWAILSNHRDVNQRTNTLPETYAAVHFERMEPGSIFISASDDTAALGLYFQVVRHRYREVSLVRSSHLGVGRPGRPGWHDRQLIRRDARLRVPDYALMFATGGDSDRNTVAAAAFANENVSSSRPVYFEVPPAPALLRPDFQLIPAGPTWKMVPRGGTGSELREPGFPMSADEIRARLRRPRAQLAEERPGGLRIRAEPYERRLLVALIRTRLALAETALGRGEFAASRSLYEEVLRIDPEAERMTSVIVPLAESCRGTGDPSRARELLRKALEQPGLNAKERSEIERLLRGN